MKKIVDGNTACSEVAYLFSELSAIYPITPSSPMASNVDNLSNKKKNLFNEDVKVILFNKNKDYKGLKTTSWNKVYKMIMEYLC